MALHPDRLKEIVESSISMNDRRHKRKAFVDYMYPNTIWTRGVPYSIHPSIGESSAEPLPPNPSLITPASNTAGRARDSVIRAINFWQAETCIDFRPRTNERQFVEFIGNDVGCWSTVGKDDALGRQVVSIGRGCEHVSSSCG